MPTSRTEMIEQSDVADGVPHPAARPVRDRPRPDPSRTASHLAGEIIRPMAWRKIPMITHQEQYLTARGPMKEWFDRARAHGSTTGVPCPSRCSRCSRGSTSKKPGGRWSWSLTTIDHAAEALADELADHAWGMRLRFMEQESSAPTRPIAHRRRSRSRHVLLSDTGRLGPRRIERRQHGDPRCARADADGDTGRSCRSSTRGARAG